MSDRILIISAVVVLVSLFMYLLFTISRKLIAKIVILIIILLVGLVAGYWIRQILYDQGIILGLSNFLIT